MSTFTFSHCGCCVCVCLYYRISQWRSCSQTVQLDEFSTFYWNDKKLIVAIMMTINITTLLAHNLTLSILSLRFDACKTSFSPPSNKINQLFLMCLRSCENSCLWPKIKNRVGYQKNVNQMTKKREQRAQSAQKRI